MNYFGRNLKYLLKRFDVTQDELALQTDKKRSSISNWINEISMPNVADLIAIRQYFGISIDCLILEDLKNSKVVTDQHVQEFQRKSKVLSKVIGKVQPVSKAYFVSEEDSLNVVEEPNSVVAWSMMGQLKIMDEKLDSLRVLAQKLVDKNTK